MKSSFHKSGVVNIMTIFFCLHTLLPRKCPQNARDISEYSTWDNFNPLFSALVGQTLIGPQITSITHSQFFNINWSHIVSIMN